MGNLEFKPLDEDHFLLYKRWFTDPELLRWIDTPSMRWFRYIQSDPQARSWMVYNEQELVGQVQVDTTPNEYGSVSVVINPSLRNQGYRRSILQLVLSEPQLANLHGFEGYVEPGNLAARAICEVVGFQLAVDEPDEEGFLKYVYQRVDDQKAA